MNATIVLTYVLIAMSPSSEVTKVSEYTTNAKFKISMYLEDNEPQVHNVVVDEFVAV